MGPVGPLRVVFGGITSTGWKNTESVDDAGETFPARSSANTRYW